jgi:predicted O-methyltransferase YrrM
MPITITDQVYTDHPQIGIIKECLRLAQEEVSGIPDYALQITGMSGIVYRRFINNYIRTLTDPRYLEVGVFQGSTLCSAIGSIDNIKAIGVDNYTESYPHYSTTPEQDARRNIEAVKTETADVQLLNQSFESFDPALYGPYDVYMYDGWHEEESQYQGIVRVAPHLADISLVVVDDWNDNNIFEVEYKGVKYTSREKAGTYRAFDDSNLEILYKIEVETGENPMFPSPWHNGYGIFLIKNNK